MPIRIARVQAPGGEPVWVFSRQTVANVPALYEAYGPTRFEKALPPLLREQAFWTLAWWEVIALPLILLAGALAVEGRDGVLLWRAFSHPGYITNTSGDQPLMQVR